MTTLDMGGVPLTASNLVWALCALPRSGRKWAIVGSPQAMGWLFADLAARSHINERGWFGPLGRLTWEGDVGIVTDGPLGALRLCRDPGFAEPYAVQATVEDVAGAEPVRLRNFVSP